MSTKKKRKEKLKRKKKTGDRPLSAVVKEKGFSKTASMFLLCVP